MARFLNFIWYTDYFLGIWLVPFSMLYIDSVRFRRYLYRIGVRKTSKLTVPIIIIGNITVGGTGKTPLVLWLAQYLKEQGFHPGIISRGYGGNATQWPQRVDPSSDPHQVGDEAVMIAKKSSCPIAVGPLRVESAQLLIKDANCDVILSDDGLQHYALGRDIEIIVIDGQRRFGNSYFLPAGPLREPISRIQEVDLVICNGPAEEENEFSMEIQGEEAINLKTQESKKLSAFKNQFCHAIAGIGNPQRFFDLLQEKDIDFKAHYFRDHHDFQAKDIEFKDSAPVLMTEKDAVKCTTFATEKHWYVPVYAKPQQAFINQLMVLINKIKSEKALLI